MSIGFARSGPKRLLTPHCFGRSTGYYVAVIVQAAEFYDRLIAGMLQTADIRPLVAPPPSVEVSVRFGNDRSRRLFLINRMEEPKTIVLHGNMASLCLRPCRKFIL